MSLVTSLKNKRRDIVHGINFPELAHLFFLVFPINLSPNKADVFFIIPSGPEMASVL
jgi:hypothetical protein